MKQKEILISNYSNGNKKWILYGDYARKNLSKMYSDNGKLSFISPRFNITEHGVCVVFVYDIITTSSV